MNITAMDFPVKSLLFPRRETYDYIDSFGGVFDDAHNAIGIDDVADAFVQPLPRWIAILMNVRNRIVSLAGLKTSKKSHEIRQSQRWIPGNKIGFFNVYDRTANEVILGEDDTHLNFRVSLFLDTHDRDPLKKIVAVTTVVIFNNWLGHVYFFFVKPFHKRIVPAMLQKDFSQFT